MNKNNLTQLLSQLGQGNKAAIQQITPIILDELHRLARHYMHNERPGHTLQATALVNEAWIKLVDMDVTWQDRIHFYAIAARQMRHILIDHARAKSADKRGGGLIRVDLDDALEITSDNFTDLIYLDRLLNELEQFDERASRLFELRLFSGLNNAAIAEAEQISIATVEREIRSARAWIQNELGKNDG
jgi:RNA polymerase sigma factor (TIGR02999 family)